jgi:hypothetical protein
MEGSSSSHLRCASAPLSFPLLPPLLRPSKCPSSRCPGHCSTRSRRRRLCLLPYAPCLRPLCRSRYPIRPAGRHPRPFPDLHFTGISTSPTRLVAREKRKLSSSLSSASSSSASSVYGDGAGSSNKGRARPLPTNRAWRWSDRVTAVEE